MKLSALTLVFSTILVPLAAVSATQFKCQTTGIFHSKDDTKNPHVPSRGELSWMGDEVLETFTSSYESNDDLNMLSDRLVKFSMKREQSPDDDGDDDFGDDGEVVTTGNSTSPISFMDSPDSLLGNLRKSRGWVSYYWHKWRADSIITCRWCGHPDDDWKLGESGHKSIEEVLTNSEEHAAWENAFCGRLQATKEYSSAFKCKIKFSNCVPETPGNDDANDDSNKGSADNYMVSDLRSVLPDDQAGVIYTFEAVEHAVADQLLLASE